MNAQQIKTEIEKINKLKKVIETFIELSTGNYPIKDSEIINKCISTVELDAFDNESYLHLYSKIEGSEIALQMMLDKKKEEQC